jgi:hypothetical protein
MKNTTLSYFLIFYTLLVATSCKDFNNPEQIPAYVHIAPFQKQTNASQGSESHQVTEAWTYADLNFLGVYEPGRTYPVLAEGLTNFRIFGGIRENAIDELIAIYPLYDSIVINKELKAGRTDTIYPVLRYHPKATFKFVEDFESNHIFTYDVDENTNTRLEVSSEFVKEGARSGKMEVNEDNPVNEIGTTFIFEDLPAGGMALFLEFDYFIEVPLFVGLEMYNPNEAVQKYFKLQLLPRSGWNKVYVRFNEEIQGFRKKGYRFIFSTNYDAEKEGQPQRAFIDNVKLIHL